MPNVFTMWRTTVEDGIAQADSTLVTVILYGPGETIDPNDGADLRIIDADGDGLVDADEFRDATGGGGLGLNGGGTQLLFDGDPGSGNDGFLYSPLAVAEGEDINAFIDDLGSSFTPVDLEDIQTPDEDMEPGPVPVCFAAGTLIATPIGPRLVEDLKIGDMVETRDNGPRPLVWVGGSTVSARSLEMRPQTRPILIRQGTLGSGLPSRDLVVSPLHRILVASKIAERMTGAFEVLVTAKKLLPLEGVDVLKPKDGVEYRHLLFDRHEIVFSEGAQTESLFNGPNALNSLAGLMGVSRASLNFGPARIDTEFAPVRPFVKGRKAEKLIARHLAHGMPLVNVREEARHIEKLY